MTPATPPDTRAVTVHIPPAAPAEFRIGASVHTPRLRVVHAGFTITVAQGGDVIHLTHAQSQTLVVALLAMTSAGDAR